MRLHPSPLLSGLLVLSLLSGCAADGYRGARTSPVAPSPSAGSTLPTIASPTFAKRVGAERQRERLVALDRSVEALRSVSTAGWQARQDDETGAVAELSGGVIRYAAGTEPVDMVRSFLAEHGAMFGLGGRTGIAMPPSISVDLEGVAALRTVQTVDGVPVDGSSFLVVIRRVPTVPELSFVRAHVFPGIETSTEPRLDATAARSAATSELLSEVTGEPILVLTSDLGTHRLAWRVDGVVRGASKDVTGIAADSALVPGVSVTVHVDAQTGDIVSVRSSGVETFRTAANGDGPRSLAAEDLSLPAPGEPVEITATVLGGRRVTLPAERLADGSIAFIDRSQPGADRSSGRGLSVVYRSPPVPVGQSGPAANGSDNQNPLANYPGSVVTAPSGGPFDTDTVTAAWAAKAVLDYYRVEHGQASFDNRGAPLVSSVHSASPVANCNAFFAGFAGQMVYGEPCFERGRQTTLSMVDPGVVAHEITHGVTSSSAPGINQSGQGGALNEAMSDYFGLIVQNRLFGEDSSTIGTAICQGMRGRLCQQFADGRVGSRSLDSGAIFDDYQFFLREPNGLLDGIFDSGGIHANGLVWTNALWRIRRGFASGDGGDMNTSAAAKRFDRVVYRALTTYFTNDTDMVDAAAAVHQASLDLDDVTAPERRLIVEQFVASQLCQGCTLPDAVPFEPVAVSRQVKHRPSITGSGVAYTEFLGVPGAGAFAMVTKHVGTDGAPRQISPQGWLSVYAAARGDHVVQLALRPDGRRARVLLTTVSTAKSTVLETHTQQLSPAFPAIGTTHVVWVARGPVGWLLRARPIGGRSVVEIAVSGDVAHLAIDGAAAAVQLVDGSVLRWDLATNALRSVGAFPKPIMAFGAVPGQLVIRGDVIYALVPGEDIVHWQVLRIGGDDRVQSLSSTAFPAGIAVDGDVAVWAETSGPVRTGISGVLGTESFDSDLVAYNERSGVLGSIVRIRGQQGFPSLRGNRLVWQDSVAGADDVYGLTLDREF